MLQQQTIKQSVGYSGVGLHSGNRVNMTLLPAPPDTGVRFRRVDLDGKPEIEARIDNVSETTRSTTLSKGNIKVHTIEHLMATFAGFNIDNIIVELDANEPPIGDGSARIYSQLVEQAGVVPQNVGAQSYVVQTPFEFQMGDTLMSVFPNDKLKITCTSADKQGRFTQFFSTEITPETYKTEIAQARTFCFYEEIEYLIKNGLIKGGSLENAIVIRDDAVLTTEPLRYPEEFVRHKILDILGDVALIGKRLQAHIIAVRPSHTANCELARRIVSQITKAQVAMQTFTPPPQQEQKRSEPQPSSQQPAVTKIEDGATLDNIQVMNTLPHRYPFLMIDKVVQIKGNTIRAIKNVTINEPYFQGHFPNHPIMPGVLQLEAIAQVSGILMLRQAEFAGKIAYFMSAENVKWRKPVRPGDTIVIDIELVKVRGKIGKAKGVCSVDGEVVSEADVTFMLIDR
ncbi:MAG TPA: bifunctional UDP-3-O-[3-hydroxymyristoyl] N-acetylglucosamine deacetylase/3-hydroxyacyl-ACP dehydratase [Verrucomicrobiota bacterium]|nr:bifunctional UDP-3-O-[3-hydroxymyristoyl] N-acetylglucosamine deacetylase/3-hydroxyacyl-ACP dehydratase [Verrucomicrobiota bacterium]